MHLFLVAPEHVGPAGHPSLGQDVVQIHHLYLFIEIMTAAREWLGIYCGTPLMVGFRWLTFRVAYHSVEKTVDTHCVRDEYSEPQP